MKNRKLRMKTRKFILVLLAKHGTLWYSCLTKQLRRGTSRGTVHTCIKELIDTGAIVYTNSSKTRKEIKLSRRFINEHINPSNMMITHHRVGFINVRVVAYRDGDIDTYSGVYHPAAILEGNKVVNARFVCRILVPSIGYDIYGHLHKKFEPYLVTFWNSRDAEEGKGQADLAAKLLSPGQEMCIQTHMRSYTSLDGSLKTGFIAIPGTLLVGKISKKQEAREIQCWVGQANVGEYPKLEFGSRPPLWDHPGTPDYKLWNYTFQPFISDAKYSLNDARYGHAFVRN